jgi:phosphoribosylformylglycinamidine synthase subunit PurQ / glutaminase
VSRQAKSSSLRALVITAPGINCDGELCEAFELAGCTVESELLTRLSREPAQIDRYDLIGLPGGFSYGDDIAAGRIMAALIRQSIYPALAAAIERGVPMMTPCNGFQIAVQAGLLPGPNPGEAWSDVPGEPTVALAQNATARFNDIWTTMEIPANTRCVWTRGLVMDSDTALIPCAHGEGRFVAEEETVAMLEANGQVAVRYGASDHFNGSVNRIAGICDASGLVFGLMPHPERYLRWTQHPRWTRLSEAQRAGDPPGLQMFKNAVAHAVARREGAGARR